MQSTINNIVSGRNSSATISTIKKLCDGLGITIEDFFHSKLLHELEQEIKKNIARTDRFCAAEESIFPCAARHDTEGTWDGGRLSGEKCRCAIGAV